MTEKLLESFRHLLDSIIAAAPKVAVGILLVVVGLALAKFVEIVLCLILVRMRFDRLVEKAGVDKALQKDWASAAIERVYPAACILPCAFSAGTDGQRRSGTGGYLERDFGFLLLPA
jgi:hypothetical protein